MHRLLHPMLVAMTLSVVTLAGCSSSGKKVTNPPTDEGDFHPTANTTLQGTHKFASMTIPSGVVVTATDGVVLDVTGPVSISGTLAGNCVPISISGRGAMTVEGTVQNSCAGATSPSPPGINLTCNGRLTMSGATIQSSGAVAIKNDSTLTDASFPLSPSQQDGLASQGTPSDGVASPAFALNGMLADSNVVISNTSFVAFPRSAATGTEGKIGGSGADGSAWVISCRGNLTFSGGVDFTGQGGGRGGRGQDNNATLAQAEGGNGGKGGAILIRSTGQIVVSGVNSIHGGDGGVGGEAVASGTPGAAGTKAASATATSGPGGLAGLIEAKAVRGFSVSGTLALVVGKGGDGGVATATGADGQSADASAAQIGGDAEAIGGNGGDAPDKILTGTFLSGLTNISVTGGAGGTGGRANAHGGRGGNGGESVIAAAAGGNPTARAGIGGSSGTRDPGGSRVGAGGNGGLAAFSGGDGGDGATGCRPPRNPDPGGNGGGGGNASGQDGAPGTGLIAGNPGGVTLTDLCNGGKGGDGAPVGQAGPAGANSTTPIGSVNQSGQAFTQGQTGLVCP